MGRVLIVGGGAAGLAMAIILGRYRVPSVILDAQPGAAPAGGAGDFAWLPPGLDLLDWLGLADRFAGHGTWRRAHEIWAGGRLRAVVPFDPPDGPGARVLDCPSRTPNAFWRKRRGKRA